MKANPAYAQIPVARSEPALRARNRRPANQRILRDFARQTTIGLAALTLCGCGSEQRWAELPESPFWPGAPSEYSIGIAVAPDPFAIPAVLPELEHPALDADSVPDLATAYTADPFLFRDRDRWHMFYELLQTHPRRGCIGWAESVDGRSWTHVGIALAEPFHLSYPHVFEWEGRKLMVVESYRIGEVRLYEARDFPRDWEPVATLVRKPLVDPSLVRHNDRWWLFASTPNHRDLHLFHSERLEEGWQEHPASPVVRNDLRIARPAGRFLHYQDRLWRVAQDCYPRYGSATRLFEIVELAPETYADREHPDSPLLRAGLVPWAELGMHHYDASPMPDDSGHWLVVVDGNRRAQPAVPLDIRFEDGSMLLGATLRPAQPRAGDPLLLRLYWKNLPEKDRALVFAHFLQGRTILFQGDHDLNERAEQYDMHIAIPADAPPGPVRVRIGLYRPDGRRLRSRTRLPRQRRAVSLPVSFDIVRAPSPISSSLRGTDPTDTARAANGATD